MDMIKPVRIFLDMPADGPLAKAIKQTLPGTGDQPTHVYVDSNAEADLVFDSALVERAGGLASLVTVIDWVRDPQKLAPLNSDAWIMRVLGKEKAERIWCATTHV